MIEVMKFVTAEMILGKGMEKILGADNVLKLNWGESYMKIFILFKKIIESHAYNFGHFVYT